MDVKVVHAHCLLFLNVVRLAATCDRLFSVLQHQFTKNRSAANLDLINLIISGPDAEQRASKAGVYASGIGANGQKNDARKTCGLLPVFFFLNISNPGPRKTLGKKTIRPQLQRVITLKVLWVTRMTILASRLTCAMGYWHRTPGRKVATSIT